MDMPPDAAHEEAFAERYQAARAHLRREMDRLGLREADGWRIDEISRDGRRGSEVVLRPIHLRLPSPPGLECVVWMDEEGESIDAECSPGGLRP